MLISRLFYYYLEILFSRPGGAAGDACAAMLTCPERVHMDTAIYSRADGKDLPRDVTPCAAVSV